MLNPLSNQMQETMVGPPDMSDYQFEFQFDELLVIQLGTHCQNSASQPRIRWHIENTDISGEDATIRVPPNRSDSTMPYGTLDVAEPRLVFGQSEDPRPAIKPESRMIDTEERETITLPNQLAADVRDRLEELGTVAENNQLCTDRSVFPSIIHSNEIYYDSTEWEQAGWEPERKVMWYADQDDQFPRRSYQIEDGELIWREFDLKTPSEVSEQLQPIT
jgi:hypothetical protein